MWSISYTDWLNSVLTSDSLGEVILAVLPQICHTPQYIKRTLERRFPVYFTSLVAHDANSDEMGGGEEDEGAAAEQRGGEVEADGGSRGSGSSRAAAGKDSVPQFQTYKEAARKYYLQLSDNNVGNFTGGERCALWKRMKNTETKAKINLDESPLGALHKVRFSPNFCCHTWVVSGGRAGLVRLHCLRGMFSTPLNMTPENEAHFHALYSFKEPEAGNC